MMDQIWTDLAAPVDDNELEWRVQRCGKKNDKVWAILVPYVQNRAIQRRLDNVIGPANWQNIFNPVGGGTEHGLSCGIGIRTEDQWVWKWDGAPFTHIEAIKGGHSDSMKRAAVHWGIGRYLYEFPVVFAANIQAGYPKGNNRINIKSDKDDIQACCPAPSQDDILSSQQYANPASKPQETKREEHKPANGPTGRTIKSKYGTIEKPNFCHRCKKRHITVGTELFQSDDKWVAVVCPDNAAPPPDESQMQGDPDLPF